MTVCVECGHEMEIGSWPWCPHGSARESNALAFDRIVLWQSIVNPDHYAPPGRADEPVPDGYRAVDITNLRQYDQVIGHWNEAERSRLHHERLHEKAYWDARTKERRDSILARIGSNPKARELFRAACERVDARREKRYAQKIAPNLHSQILSYDSGNRQGYSSRETGWRDRKA